jgi:hypothetical protein
VTDPAEEELPQPQHVDVEELGEEEIGRRRDHDQLEDGPAEALQDVEACGQVGPPPTERCALQHHRRHACVGADQGREAEQRVADQPADERRRQRVPQREVEVRWEDEDQQRDPEVDPQQRRVDEAENPEPLGHRLDSPVGCLHRCVDPPFAGANRIRFDGCDLSPLGAPRCRGA